MGIILLIYLVLCVASDLFWTTNVPLNCSTMPKAVSRILRREKVKWYWHIITSLPPFLLFPPNFVWLNIFTVSVFRTNKRSPVSRRPVLIKQFNRSQFREGDDTCSQFKGNEKFFPRFFFFINIFTSGLTLLQTSAGWLCTLCKFEAWRTYGCV